MKMMLITFFDIKDIIHFEFIPQGHIFNQACCVEIWKWLYELWPIDWILHQDNAPAHKALSL
jgi:hypothetical protein